ncbi:MAG: TIGR02281 family clan AA aspartic protease [Gammaproteobacteria bacterium]|nr:TIGR02281 family clan AA aspartic protease [Gammaproteobacteria bacterium]
MLGALSGYWWRGARLVTPPPEAPQQAVAGGAVPEPPALEPTASGPAPLVSAPSTAGAPAAEQGAAPAPFAEPVRLSITARRGGKVRQTDGVVVGREALIVVPLPSLVNLSKVSVAYQRENFPVAAVVAIDAAAELALLDAGLAGRVQPLPLAPDGAVYLGRRVATGLRNRRIGGYVDSSAEPRPGGGYRHRLLLDAQPGSGLMPLLSEDGTELIGLAIADRRRRQVEAIDAASVHRLLEARAAFAPLSPAELETAYFTTTVAGQLIRLREAVKARQWDLAVRLGEALYYSGHGDDAQVRKALNGSYAESARRAARSREIDQATAILARADALLGPDPDRLLLSVYVLQRAQQPRAALEKLMTGLEQGMSNDQLRTVLRKHTQGLLSGSGLSLADKIMLLNRAAALDPAEYRYQVDLGRQLAHARRYGEALAAFNSAVLLNPAIADELADEMLRAEQRSAMPGRTLVPLRSDGASLYAQVELNGGAGYFDFVVDTGASVMTLSEATAAAIGVDMRADGPRMRLKTAGNYVTGRMVTLDSVAVGGATVPKVKAVVLDGDPGFAGLLGLSYLKHFDVAIDQEAREMLLTPR